MADPVAVALPVKTWTKVATNATNGVITVKSWQPDNYQVDYRLNGEAAPTNLSTCVPMSDSQIEIESGVGIDVYIYPTKYAGEVIVAI